MAESQDVIVASLRARYGDSYVASQSVEAIGGVFKGLGIVLGLAVLAAAVLTASQFGAAALFSGILVAAAAGLGPFIGGILISAQGQVLKASLDTAVNTSPFLGNEERLALFGGRPAGTPVRPRPAAQEGAGPVVATCVVCGAEITEAERHVLRGDSYCDQHFGEALR